ncbi:MAG TPA: outer membrane protein transport protein [Dokdonella sp.]|uniref:OmpP1/FadL family transporter n=1 Tax=Dokdonella sp. TaxID=2291710 RepID=UPI002D7F7485|nr:outer membrane protein transport protein [Dokdonella sp.]HET9033400.1 outer membrane protein transport protein [Dokdonella sp.]
MKKLLATAVAIGLAGMTGSAFAITDNEANASIPFSFSNPGARALGMGGAFLGLADDASAAYTNPAGLTQLVSPEVSAEFRSVSTNTRWMDGGTVQYNGFDSSGLNYSSQDDRTNSLPSFSFVYPGERLSFAIYRFELVNYDSKFFSAGALYTTGDGSGAGGVVFPYQANTNLEVDAYGAAFGFKVNDRISLGFGLNYYLLDISTTTDRLNPNDLTSAFGREADLNGDGSFGFTLGARMVFTDWLSGGLSYRHAPSLDYDAVRSSRNDPNEGVTLNTDLNVPDVLGVGISIRPSDSWVINLDVNRVYYSQVTDDLESVYGSDPVTELAPLKLSDGTEVRLGAEYTFATTHPFSIRAGVWRDPAHELVYRGTVPNFDPATQLPAVDAATFSAGRSSSQTHYAIGAGVAFSQFQIDLGADFSDTSDTYSVSGVFRF